MALKRKSNTLLLASFLTLSVGLGVGAFTEPTHSTAEDPPPQSLSGVGKNEVKLTFPSSALAGDVKYHMTQKEVSIKWTMTYTQGAPTDPHVSMQTESTTFWPTEVSGAGPGRLAVAGKNQRTGHTMIELWEFALPNPFPAPYIEPTSGQKVYPTIHASVTSRRVILDESESGRQLVRTMFPNHVLDHQLLVQFQDSRDLYTLDTESEVLTPILSPAAGTSVPREPSLANDYVNRWSARHTIQGDAYFFSPNGDRNLDLLALFDHDLDGIIDEHRTLTRAEFKQLGLADGLQYVKHY